MKVEVRCNSCKCAWLVEEQAAGGQMSCPMCEAPIGASTTPAAATATPAAPVAAVAAVAPVAAVASVAAVALVADSEPPRRPDLSEVVCPRCKLHFNAAGQPEVESPLARPTVLIVEDLEYFREVASDALSVDYEVKTAQSAHEARMVLAEGGIDLLVLDLTLDGTEAGRDLLMQLDPKPCPILIFTAEDETDLYDGTWDGLKALGADDLVIKGMQVGESLVRKVGELLGMPMDES